MLYRMRAAGEIELHRETAPRDGPVQAEIAEMAARGDTYQEIADRVNKTPSAVGSTIYRVRRRVAPHLEPTAEVPPRFVPGEAQRRREEAWRLAKEGVPREEIAARFGYEFGGIKATLSKERMRLREAGAPESSLVLERPSEKEIRARHLEVWELARSGLSRDEIAKRCGYGYKRVENIVREERNRRKAAGESAEELALPGFSPHNAAKTRRAKVLAMAVDGIAPEEIADHTGYSLSWVKGIISNERVRRRDAGEPEEDLYPPLAPGARPFTAPMSWTEDQTAQLIALYEARNKPSAIAAIMGLRVSQVNSRLAWLVAHGQTARVDLTPTSGEIKELHHDYWQSGLSLTSWSAQKNLVRKVIASHFHKHGLPIRQTKPGPAPRSLAVAGERPAAAHRESPHHGRN
jgi:DNA-binding CsgD family transcriptional regulator